MSADREPPPRGTLAGDMAELNRRIEKLNAEIRAHLQTALATRIVGITIIAVCALVAITIIALLVAGP